MTSPAVLDQAHVADLLAVSAERDRWLARLVDAELDADRRGYERGYLDGHARAAADLERAWQRFARPVSRGDFADQEAASRVSRAERLCESDARAWWAEFTRRALATRPGLRSEAQQVIALDAERRRRRGPG